MKNIFNFLARTIALLFFTVSAALTGCSTMSNLPDTENLKVSREEPSKDCVSIGKIEGRSSSKIPKEEEALADLKKEAANKGANYLVVKQYSGNGTAATGIAYKCP
jgi:hypothetical protein